MAVDFIGVGAARSGTSWLHEALRRHPEVFVPEQKELHHFDNDASYSKGIDFYESHFEDKGARLSGETSPRYMLYRKSLERIHDYHQDVKIFVILRDPTERTISQYKFFTDTREKENIADVHKAFEHSFTEDYIQESLYSRQIQNLHDIFPANNFLFLSFERIFAGQQDELDKLTSFLGISPLDFSVDAVVNSSHGKDAVKDPAFIRKHSGAEPPFLRKYRSPFRVLDGQEYWAIPKLSPVAKQVVRVYSR